MALSVRLFGLSSWSLLVPQALMGVATVAVVHHGVRRATGSGGAALLAGATFALTPVAVLMFRFNNPDGLLVLLLAGAAVATLRARRRATRARLVAGAGRVAGRAGVPHQDAAGVPGAAGARPGLRCSSPPCRGAGGSLHLLGGGRRDDRRRVVVGRRRSSCGRPRRARSSAARSSNSALELVLGYNGVGRLTGAQTGAVSGPRGWGSNSVLRLLDPGTGGQASWLLPGGRRARASPPCG